MVAPEETSVVIGPDKRVSASPVPSLVGTTVRRTILVGRVYIAFGVGASTLVAIALLVAGSQGTTFELGFAVLLPLFATVGSMGGLLTFSNDRTKGVLEYLIAYGVRPLTLFLNGLLCTAAATAIILGLSLPIGLGLATAWNVALSVDFLTIFLFYTVPVTFASALLAATAGMIWTTVSTPRAGMNNPVGLAPLIAILPTILVIILASIVGSSEFFAVTDGASVAIIAAVVSFLALSGRLMGRERFLSPI